MHIYIQNNGGAEHGPFGFNIFSLSRNAVEVLPEVGVKYRTLQPAIMDILIFEHGVFIMDKLSCVDTRSITEQTGQQLV